jgi:hypothetical protein
MQRCLSCESPQPPENATCDACGKELPGWDLPENVDKYERELAEYAEDGQIEKWEQEELDRSAVRLRISFRRRDELHRKYQPLSELPLLQLRLDAALLKEFVVGANCVLNVQVENDSGRAVRNTQIRYAVHGTALCGEHPIRTLGPNKQQVVPLELQFSEAGHRVLEVWLRSETRPDDGQDRPIFFSAQATLKVAPAVGDAPQHVSIINNVDASAMRVSADPLVNVQADAARDRPHAGLHTAARWEDLPLVAQSEAKWDRWWNQRQEDLAALEAGGSSPPGSIPGLRWLDTMQGVSWVGAPPEKPTRELPTLLFAGDKELVVIPRRRASFGRKAHEDAEGPACDVRLAVEPDPDGYNYQPSIRISRLHFELLLHDRAAEFVYRGSKASTYVDGQALQSTLTLSEEPVDIVLGRDAEYVDGVLTLRCRTIAGVGRALGGAWLERRRNLETRSYLMLLGTVPIALGEPALAISPERASAFLGAVEGHAVLVNHTTTPWRSSAGSLGQRQGVVLRRGLEIEGNGWKVRIR